MSPRVPGTDPVALQRTVAEIEASFKQYPEQSDPRLHEVFWARARARWALGIPVESVLADLRSAALCLKGQASVRLFKLEPHRLRTRRIDPLHLAALHPDPELVERFGAEYGLPLATWHADAARRELELELAVMSPYFRRRAQKATPLDSPAEMTGVAAATYAAAFGYLASGDTGSAAVVLRMLAALSNSLKDAPPAPARRYLRQCAALAAIRERDDDALTSALVALLPDVSHGPQAPDLVIPSLVGLAMLANVEADVAALRDVDPLTWSLAAAVEEGWLQIE